MEGTAFDPVKFYFSMEGRIGRADFWLRLILPTIGIMALLGILFRGNTIIAGIVNLLLLWPSIAVSGKRWHDRNKSAWWMLIGLVPIIGWIWSLVETGFLKGTEGPNRFGPSPV